MGKRNTGDTRTGPPEDERPEDTENRRRSRGTLGVADGVLWTKEVRSPGGS